jgi:putative ATPase
VDEIHRFNKGQQDALLPHVEDGTVTLIGATTENPSFAVNAALLSRARVFRPRAAGGERTWNSCLGGRCATRGVASASSTSKPKTARCGPSQSKRMATRGARCRCWRCAPTWPTPPGGKLRVDDVQQALSSKTLLYDKSGEEHYNVVSAFIKSMRGNDPDAAIYWLMRMLEAGEDPRFVLRRMMIFASEDIGNADPRALELAVAADQAFARLGMPEGMFAIAQCCTYLASAPKSNASYEAWTSAQADVRERGALPVPLRLRNAPTAAMKEWGYGEGYRYPHAEGGHAAGESYLPDELVGKRYYRPRARGPRDAHREPAGAPARGAARGWWWRPGRRRGPGLNRPHSALIVATGEW